MKPFTDDDATKFDLKDIKWLAIAGGVVLVIFGSIFGLGYAMGQRKLETRATKAENAANVAKGEADAAKSQAMAKDKEIAAKDSDLALSRAEVARRLEDLRKVKAALHASVPSAPVGPSIPDQPVHTGVVDLAPLVKQQDEVIQAQSVYIGKLETKALDLAVSRDGWKTTAGAREVENLNLRAANAAKDGLIKGALWKGRIQGLAFGLAVGYVGAKR